MLAVEFCNIEIILSSDNPLDIVYNFVVLDIIAQFDDFVYSALRGESMKQLVEEAVLEKLLIIQHTTSRKCPDDQPSAVEDDDGELRRLKVTYAERDGMNKCMYLQYKCCRTFYVSVYFYFMPFFCIILSLALPILTNPNVAPSF